MVTVTPDPRPTSGFDATEPLSRSFRDAIAGAISGFLVAREAEMAGIGPELAPVLDMARQFTGGGKRLRPAFCYWGYAAVAGQPADPAALLRACASLDLLHVSALIHDDVMDASDTRRGVPAAHRQFEQLHGDMDGLGHQMTFGRAGAILLGDLLIMWSAQQLSESGLDPVALGGALPLIEAMRTEVTAGQFLDVLAQHAPLSGDVSEALALAERVVEYKSARYTVQRPVQFGAALAGADPALVAGLAGFGSPLGQAFQFRDDLLGVFGDEALTGKPAGDDLREGKRTVLVAHALAEADPREAAELQSLLGNADLDPAQIDRARTIITDSGARERVERMIDMGLERALAALDDLPLRDDGRLALRSLAIASVRRDH